jgi:hypothetical protein
MTNDGEKITADTTRSADADSSPFEHEASVVPRLTMAIGGAGSKRALGRVRNVRPQPSTDSKTLAAARHAVMDATLTSERRVSKAPLSAEMPSVSPEARIPSGTPLTLPPPLSESEHASADILQSAHGMDHDPYFQALNAERERVAAEAARVDAELARLREEYADGAPPTYFSEAGSDGLPAE